MKVPVLAILPIALVFAQSDGLRVATQQGDVAGSFSAPTVRQFLGIPYATAKRWQEPVLPPKRTSVFNASAFGDSCPQLLDAANVEFNRLAWTFNRDNETFVPESEDCLTVNIWSPATTRKQNTAILLWIYGGGSVWGTASSM
jgi:carboxylesterase type B